MLRTNRLGLRYPNGKQALDGIDLHVRAGELVVVLGGNGCGKTTLLRCISRTLTPTEGNIWLGGTELTTISSEALRRARLGMGMVAQRAALVKRSTVLANVATGALGHHADLMSRIGFLPRQELQAAAGHLASVGLADLAGQRAGTLSGGQAQRVAIARALAQRPRALLADEPVASLDPEAAEGIMCLLKTLARRDNLAVLCVLHQVDLAYSHADRVVGIRAGRVAFDAPCSEISRSAVQELYVREAA
jgi:phosphonate transport system ATP-binding protein